VDREARDLTARFTQWALRGASAVIGLLCLAVLSAAAASAQTADLSIMQAPVFSPVAAGSQVNLTITIRNNGPSAATNVAFVHFFPPNAGVLSANTIPGWSCGFSTLLYQCTIPSLAVGTSTIFTAYYQSSSETPAGAVLVNEALITSTTVDPTPANNLASLAMTIDPGGTPTAPADLAVATTGPATVSPGQPIPYTITVTNNGPQAAGFITLGETTPPNTTFVSLVAPPAWDCDTPVVGAVGSVGCSPPIPSGPLGVGGTLTFTLTVQPLVGTPTGTTRSPTWGRSSQAVLMSTRR